MGISGEGRRTGARLPAQDKLYTTGCMQRAQPIDKRINKIRLPLGHEPALDNNCATAEAFN